MTYADNFVVEVKQNGKILRVKNGAVYLPFGSEYSILLKNLNSKRASVKISIDGEDVLDNSSLVLDANASTELKGFLRGNVARNRFKFINKTKEISDHRGDRADDGLLRVEFAFEKPQPKPWIMNTIKEVHHHHNPPMDITYYGTNADWRYRSTLNSGRGMAPQSVYTASVGEKNCSNESNVTMDSLGVENISAIPNADEGITVKGSEVNQEFRYTTLSDLEKSTVVVIVLKGLTETGQTIAEPVTTQEKLVCKTCGTKSKSSFKFCPTCGTFLE
jgi:hypothetical protein